MLINLFEYILKFIYVYRFFSNYLRCHFIDMLPISSLKYQSITEISPVRRTNEAQLIRPKSKIQRTEVIKLRINREMSKSYHLHLPARSIFCRWSLQYPFSSSCSSSHAKWTCRHSILLYMADSKLLPLVHIDCFLFLPPQSDCPGDSPLQLLEESILLVVYMVVAWAVEFVFLEVELEVPWRGKWTALRNRNSKRWGGLTPSMK